MKIDFLRRTAVFIILCLVQVLMLQRISIFHCATPLLFLHFVISFRRGYPRWAILLWSFAMGLVLDMFFNTPGVNAASLTLIGLLQPYLVELFLPREAEPDIKVSARALGVSNFFTLSLILVIVFCLVYFTLESFNLEGWPYAMQCAGASTVLTLICIMTVETLR